MKKFLLSFIIFILTFNCFSEPISGESFEIDLNNYSNQKNIGFTFLMSGAIGLSLGFVSGSTFTTLNSLGIVDPSISSPMTIASYITVSVSAIVGIIGFLIWKDGIDNYLETLRIQAQYYNLTYDN